MSKGVILAVDDAVESLQLLAQILQKEGYQVRPANSGELGLASAMASPPDLILLDIRMPGMDGFDVCRRLKIQHETRNIPVVFLSATQDMEERVEGLRLGAVDFVSKPFRADELVARVQTHLELGRLRSQLERSVNERTLELRLATESLDKPLSDAVEAHDWDLVVRLFEPNALVSLLRNEAARAWLLNLPAPAFDSQPELAYWRAFVLVGNGRLRAAEEAANVAEQAWIASGDRLHQGRVRSLLSKVAELRGDGPEAVRLATEGVDLVAGGNTVQTALAKHWLGVAYCISGSPTRAEEASLTTCSLCERFVGSLRWLIPVAYAWYGRSLYLQGRLNDSLTVCRQTYSLEHQYGGPTISTNYMLEADILIRRNLLDMASQSLEKAVDPRGPVDQWFAAPAAWLTAAELEYARDNVSAGDHAVDTLVEWARRNDSAYYTDRAAAIRVRYWLKLGQTERAWLWATDKQLGDEDDLTYSREPTYLALAQLYLQRGGSTRDLELVDRAIRLLGRLRGVAESERRMGDYLSALALEALALKQSGRDRDAFETLERCLTLAVPESSFRVFLDLGTPMFKLLHAAAERGLLPETSQGLSSMFEGRPGQAEAAFPKSMPSPTSVDQLINPLTDREFELLALIASGLTNAELAESLFISNNTVKTHVKHLFQKLNASTRTQAVARARALGLLVN